MQALSNTVWAFSKLEVLDVELFSNIAREAVAKLPRFNAQNMANTVSRPQLHKYYLCAALLLLHPKAILHARHSRSRHVSLKLVDFASCSQNMHCTTSPGSMALDGDCTGG